MFLAVLEGPTCITGPRKLQRVFGGIKEVSAGFRGVNWVHREGSQVRHRGPRRSQMVFGNILGVFRRCSAGFRGLLRDSKVS